MSELPDDFEIRRAAASAAIRRAHGTPEDEHGATLFIAHHIEELADEYWVKHCGVETPTASQVLDILVPKPSLEEEEELDDMLDFTLPDDVTDYVICVEFDEDGHVAGITMES